MTAESSQPREPATPPAPPEMAGTDTEGPLTVEDAQYIWLSLLEMDPEFRAVHIDDNGEAGTVPNDMIINIFETLMAQTPAEVDTMEQSLTTLLAAISTEFRSVIPMVRNRRGCGVGSRPDAGASGNLPGRDGRGCRTYKCDYGY